MNPIIREQRWSKRTWQSFFHTNIAFLFFVHRRFIDKGCRDSRINQSRLIPSEKRSWLRVAENFEFVGIGTYLLPCGLQTIMDFSLTTLPVETALIFWTFWTWAMDCMLYIFICFIECIYEEYRAVLSSFGKVFFAFSRFFQTRVRRSFVLASCSFFFYFRMRRGNQIDDAEPNLRQLSSTMTRSRKETQGTN